MLKTSKKVADGFLWVYSAVGLVALVLVIVFAFLQVVARYLLPQAPTWTEEGARYAFIWMSMMGASAAARHCSNASVDLLDTLFRGKGKGIFAGITLGCALRFIVHYISGVTIYAITMPTECLGMTFINKWTYSLVYNGSYMLLDTVICLVIFALLYKPLDKYIQARDVLAVQRG